MKDFSNKVAVITGAASGIGLAAAQALASEGMHVVLLDNRAGALQEAAASIIQQGVRVLALELDISDAAAVAVVTQRVIAEFGAVHLLINNAAVFMRGHDVCEPGDEVWDWLLQVNLYGTLHCLRSFLPHLQAHGEEAHIVNTGSISGFVVRDRKNGLYATSKFALVGLSEALAHDLRDTKVRVSVLFPAAVASHFYENSAQHRGELGGPNLFPVTPEATANGMLPAEVAARMLDGIRQKRFYIATHSDSRKMVEERHAEIMAAYDAAERFDESSRSE